MTELDLLDAIGSIDKKYIEAANENSGSTKSNPKKKMITKWLPLVACLGVVAALGIGLAVHFAGDKEGINEKIGQMASATDKISDSKETESGDGMLWYSEKYDRQGMDEYIEDGTDARVTPEPDMQFIDQGLRITALSVP
ncbi:MAG: hypothetical protein J6X68_05060, partial [Lachnospiraceae bacterium]|nr:hypothetical protein [Lachnospiraceae bacterium]